MVACPCCSDDLLHRLDCCLGLSITLRVPWWRCVVMESPFCRELFERFGCELWSLIWPHCIGTAISWNCLGGLCFVIKGSFGWDGRLSWHCLQDRTTLSMSLFIPGQNTVSLALIFVRRVLWWEAWSSCRICWCIAVGTTRRLHTLCGHRQGRGGCGCSSIPYIVPGVGVNALENR